MLDRDKEENSDIIQQMKSVQPRPNGKQICEKLRSIRKEFSKLNSIEIEFKEYSKTHTFNMEILEEIVRTDNKQRFTFNEDKTKIRANQGYSILGDVELEETKN